MQELPEAVAVARQVAQTLGGKGIVSAVAGTTPHKFTWFTGDPAAYNERLAGKVLGSAWGVASFVEVEAGDMRIAVSAPLLYHAPGTPRPAKHQLLLELDDGSAVSATALMWGCFFCYPEGAEAVSFEMDPGHRLPSPLTDAFDRAYFETLFTDKTPGLSAKAFLATEQRIPGLGNGVLQDILWSARVRARRKMGDLSAAEIDALFVAVKGVLAKMAAQGGRDTERDLFGKPGGYRTVMCRTTEGAPCPVCGTPIRKESFQGSSSYFCEECQPL